MLNVAPKVASDFTYVGRVWVHATDFAVVRIQGKPAVNPSPWVSEGEFTTDFQKIGEFYFPQRTVSTSNLPLGLHARLIIQYGPYRILSVAPVRPAARLSLNKANSRRTGRSASLDSRENMSDKTPPILLLLIRTPG